MADGGGPLRWFFELFDRISGPASKMKTGLEGVDDAMKKVTGAHDKLKRAHDAGGHATEGFRHKLFETLEIGARVGEMFEGVAHHAIEFGSEIIKAAAGTETATMAFETFLGKGKAAREELEKMERIAPKTALQGNELRNMSLGLVRSGFRGEELTRARAAALDIGALNPLNPQGAQQGAEMLAGFRERGGIRSTRQLMELAQTTGVGLPELQGMLAKQFNTKAANVAKLIESGKVDSEHAIQLVYDAIQKQTGGPLGTAAEKHGSTVAALMHKVGGLGEDLFEGLNTSKGYEQFRGFLENVTTVFTGPEGTALKTSVGDLFDTVMDMIFGATSGPKGLPAMQRVVQGITGAVESLNVFVQTARDTWNEWGETFTIVGGIVGTFIGVVWTIVKAVEAWEAVQGLLNVALLANPLGAVILAVTAVGAAIYEVVKHWDELKDALSDTKTLERAWKFITFQSANPDLDNAHQMGREVGTAIKNGAQDALEIHSPSRVFQRLGVQSAQGFADGMNRGADIIDLAAERALRADAGGGGATTAVGGPAAGGGRRVVLDLTVTVNGAGGSNPELAAELAEQLRGIVREEIADAGERYGVEMGAA
jgi:hypothetical protein